jgi:hypothetical protein
VTIEGLLVGGFLAGLLVGLTITKQKLGCLILLTVPVAMILYISWWQDQNPEALGSTSALDFVFGPLWPSLSAIAGFYVGMFVRSHLSKK